MSFDIVEMTLASALAASGTLTVSYPTGRSKGSYVLNNGKHVMIAGGNEYEAPDNFTVVFNANASSITLTWGSGQSTLPAGTSITLQLDRAGVDGFSPTIPASVEKMAKSDVYLVNLGSPNVLDADGIAASQSIAEDGSAVLDGDVGATLDVPRNVVGSWTGTAVATVTGLDEHGNVVVESSASGTSLTGKKAFKSITSISMSAAVTSATFGTGDVLGLPVFLPSEANIIAELIDGQLVSPAGKVWLPFIVDATMLSAGTTVQVPCTVKGHITRVTTVVQTEIATGGTLTFSVNAGSAITGLGVVVANSTTVGGIDTDTPTAPEAVAVGDSIQILVDAAFNGGGALAGLIEVDTRGVRGTVVAGYTAAVQSATTADVRGTYDPEPAMDGSTQVALLMALQDPTNIGASQYDG